VQLFHHLTDPDLGDSIQIRLSIYLQFYRPETMLSRFSFSLFIILLSTCYPAFAQGGAEQANNQQSPLQVIVSIVVSAIVLRALENFKLP
jgi:hypothetical protein